jgi:hypothetical protein
MMLLLVLFSSVRLTSAVDILVLGDSWAAHSLDYLAGNCAGKTVLNRGVDGSTAAQWAAGSCPGLPLGCSAAAAFQGVVGVKSVWFSIGGNDFLKSGCMSTGAQISQVVKLALSALKVAAPKVKILMTGYSTPQPAVAKAIPSCNSPVLIGTLNDAIKAACTANPACKCVDAVSACGGSRATFSHPQYFQDAMHMNQMGYQSLFRMPGVQKVLSCGVLSAPPCAALSVSTLRAYSASDVVGSERLKGSTNLPMMCLFACSLLVAGATTGIVLRKMRLRYDGFELQANEDDAADGAMLLQ